MIWWFWRKKNVCSIESNEIQPTARSANEIIDEFDATKLNFEKTSVSNNTSIFRLSSIVLDCCHFTNCFFDKSISISYSTIEFNQNDFE